MLLSAEAAKAAQKANLENNLETAQHALQDKQQVSTFLMPLCWHLVQSQHSVLFHVSHIFTFENICHFLT